MAPPSDQDEHPLHGGRVDPEAGRASTADPLDVTLNADWVAASVARDRVERWLRTHRWPAAQIDELVLAVSEAVSNSVEHGYAVALGTVGHPGVVEVCGRLSTAADGFRRAELTVRDHGSWRQPATDRPTRGHGMLIMRSCTDELVVGGTPEGTTVVLRSRPAPPVLRRI